jgi:hypothetical protein
MANFGIGIGLNFGVGIPLQYPLINGFAPSWASIEAKPQILGGAPLPVLQTIQSIDYEPGNNSKEVRGTNPNPLAVTRGEISNTGKFKILLYELNQFLLALAAVDPTGNGAYGDVFFDLQVQYAESGGPIITDSLRGCRIYKVSQSSSIGPDAIVKEVDLRPMQILLNGMPMSSAVLSAIQFP